MELGQELSEAWLVCCAATYVWNYCNHVLHQRRHRTIIETLQKLVDGLTKVGHAGYVASIIAVLMRRGTHQLNFLSF